MQLFQRMMLFDGNGIPRYGLLKVIKKPNSDDYLEDEDIERDEGTYTWGFLLDDDDTQRAATGWTSGNGWETAGNPLYLDDGTPRTAWATEIAAWVEVNEWCVFFRLTSAERQEGILAVYDSSIMTLTYAEKIVRTMKVDGFLARTLLWGAYQSDPETSKSGPDIDWSYTYPLPAGDGATITSGLPIDQSSAKLGLHCGPGYTNLIKNSKFIGAVSGSPGTPPTNWSIYNTTGSISALDESISISTVNTYFGIRQTFSVSANTVYYFSVECTIDLPRIVSNILTIYSVPTGASIVFSVDGTSVTGGTSVSAGSHVVSVILTVSSTAGTPYLVIGNNITSGGSFTGTSIFSNPQLTTVKNAPYVATGVDQTITLGSCAGSSSGGARWPMESSGDEKQVALYETFNGTNAVGCVAALVTMGVGSSDLATSEIISALSCKAASDGMLAFADVAGNGYITSKDGTSTVSVACEWDALDTVLVVVQVSGSYRRIGKRVYGDDSDIVWSHSNDDITTWGAFDGSFNPGTAEILAYANTRQSWLKSQVAWKDRLPTSAEIIANIEGINA